MVQRIEHLNKEVPCNLKCNAIADPLPARADFDFRSAPFRAGRVVVVELGAMKINRGNYLQSKNNHNNNNNKTKRKTIKTTAFLFSFFLYRHRRSFASVGRRVFCLIVKHRHPTGTKGEEGEKERNKISQRQLLGGVSSITSCNLNNEGEEKKKRKKKKRTSTRIEQPSKYSARSSSTNVDLPKCFHQLN